LAVLKYFSLQIRKRHFDWYPTVHGEGPIVVIGIDVGDNPMDIVDIDELHTQGYECIARDKLY